MLKLLLILPLIQIVSICAQEQAKAAQQTESPWMVHIEVKEKICGGALIDDYHVLTAAHCFDGLLYSYITELQKIRQNVKIKIGEWKTKTDPDCSEENSDEICDTTADILPKEIIIHEKYNKRRQDRFQYDIALIKLSWPPRRSEIVNVIRLAGPERCDEMTTSEYWKTTGFGGGSTIKKMMEMVVISHEECVKSIDKVQAKRLNKDVHVCARGINGEKTCKGDVGNPVTNLVEGVSYIQAIVLSDQDECIETDTNTASVFLKVSCFHDWILQKVPNINQAFTEKPKPKPSSHENKDTGSLEVYTADELTTLRPMGTTLGKVRPSPVTTTTKPSVTYKKTTTKASNSDQNLESTERKSKTTTPGTITNIINATKAEEDEKFDDDESKATTDEASTSKKYSESPGAKNSA